MKKGNMSGRQVFCALSFVVAWAAVSTAAGATLTAASYAQDGLVGQWDGLENAGVGLYDATTNYWTDLTGQSGPATSRCTPAARPLRKMASRRTLLASWRRM